ncbi:MAG: hypothetical protein Q9207_007361 [Kuettlingeria erythrocarpa]
MDQPMIKQDKPDRSLDCPTILRPWIRRRELTTAKPETLEIERTDPGFKKDWKLPPKTYPHEPPSLLFGWKTIHFVAIFCAGGLSIALPFVLLQTLVSRDARLDPYDPATTMKDGSPVWRCQSSGYLKGFDWTFLEFDIRFGRMPFNQAKCLDLVWNWVVGRGLQAFLAWITFPIHTAALMRITETTSVPYDFFAALALFSTSPGSLWVVAKAVFKIPGIRVKFILSWLLISITYLAAVPSLLDVMSGYETSIRTELSLPNGTRLDTTDLNTFEGHLYYCLDLPRSYPPCSFIPYPNEITIAFYDSMLNSSYYALPNEGKGLDDYYRSAADFWTVGPKNYNCVTQKDMYQWGFSGEWILIVSTLHSVWLLGLWILWLDTERKSQFIRKGRRMGTYRAVADITEAMIEDLGENICAYSEKELAVALKRRGPIKYYVDPGINGEWGRIGLSSRDSGRARLQWDKEYG